MGKYIHFRARRCPNYRLNQNSSNKSYYILILYKKVSRHTCLSPSGEEPKVPKIDMFQILYYTEMEK